MPSSWLLYRRIVMTAVGIDVGKAALDAIVDGVSGAAPMASNEWLGGPSPESLIAESDLREEGRDVTRKALRLLRGGEVPAARHRGPPANVVKPLHPLARRASL